MDELIKNLLLPALMGLAGMPLVPVTLVLLAFGASGFAYALWSSYVDTRDRRELLVKVLEQTEEQHAELLKLAGRYEQGQREVTSALRALADLVATVAAKL